MNERELALQEMVRVSEEMNLYPWQQGMQEARAELVRVIEGRLRQIFIYWEILRLRQLYEKELPGIVLFPTREPPEPHIDWWAELINWRLEH